MCLSIDALMNFPDYLPAPRATTLLLRCENMMMKPNAIEPSGVEQGAVKRRGTN